MFQMVIFAERLKARQVQAATISVFLWVIGVTAGRIVVWRIVIAAP